MSDPEMTPVREKLRKLRQRQARGWQLLTGDWRHLVEKPLPAADLSALMEQASLPTFSFYFMLALATAIATTVFFRGPFSRVRLATRKSVTVEFWKSSSIFSKCTRSVICRLGACPMVCANASSWDAPWP